MVSAFYVGIFLSFCLVYAIIQTRKPVTTFNSSVQTVKIKNWVLFREYRYPSHSMVLPRVFLITCSRKNLNASERNVPNFEKFTHTRIFEDG